MFRALTLALACAAAAQQEPSDDPKAFPEYPPPARPAARLGGGSIKLIVYDHDGKPLDLDGFLAHSGRLDRKSPPDPAKIGLWVCAPDGRSCRRPALAQKGSFIQLSWDKLTQIQLSLPWPLEDVGFSTMWADKEGRGFSDGEAVYLNEELALTQYRLFKEAWARRVKDADPPYQPGAKAEALAEEARDLMAAARAQQDGARRAKAFEKALRYTALAWEKALFEHGLQLAFHPKTKSTLRFGLTLDESLLSRMDHYEWIADAVKRSGTNWVRLVFRSNPQDFTYAHVSSFNEYDAIVKTLRTRGLRVMGCVLDTAQWPSSLTPAIYAERVKNLVFHFRSDIKSWEIGSEINGDWLGGVKKPLSLDEVFRIYSAGAAQVKDIEPTLETVATLYWWDGTAPDEAHSLFGWIDRYEPRGFSRNVDVVAVSLWPEDNPVGMAFETIFERLNRALPGKRLLLGSFGYVEQGEKASGYWWLDPDDVDGARKDLAIFYSAASLAAPRSSGGGFYWLTLDHMLPGDHKITDLYKVYRRALEQLGRKD